MGQSLDPVPPARGVLSSARCVPIVKPQSRHKAWWHMLPSMGPPRMFCSPVYGFRHLTIWKTGRGRGEKATWLPSKSSKLKETRLEAERTAVSLTSPPRRRSQTRKIFRDEKKASQQDHGLLKIKSIVSLKGRGFPETSLFFSTSKLSALSICYLSLGEIYFKKKFPSLYEA